MSARRKGASSKASACSPKTLASALPRVSAGQTAVRQAMRIERRSVGRSGGRPSRRRGEFSRAGRRRSQGSGDRRRPKLAGARSEVRPEGRLSAQNRAGCRQRRLMTSFSTDGSTIGTATAWELAIATPSSAADAPALRTGPQVVRRTRRLSSRS
jgi:hypothetical protein